MSSPHSPARRRAALALIGVLAAASLAVGVSSASAAPLPPSITGPLDGATTVSTTIAVTGSVVPDQGDQDITVLVNGAPVPSCPVISLAYSDSVFACDVTVPGPGVYTLTATSIETFSPGGGVSEVSNAVTVRVGNTNPALLGYGESGTEWNQLSPQLSGTGPALGEVVVEIIAGEFSGTYCVVAEVPVSGAWLCSPSALPSWTWGEVEFRAYGYDVTESPTLDDQIFGALVPPAPTSEIVLGPASVSLTAQGAADTWFQTRVFSAELNGEGSSFSPYEVCDSSGTPPVVTCSLSNLSPGVWNFYTQQDFEETYFEEIDEFVRIPSAPSAFAGTVLADRSVRFSGQGQPGFRVLVRDGAQNTVCSVIVAASGSWQCNVTQAVGTASYRSLQQSVGFTTNDFDVTSDRSLDGFSALSSAVSVTVPPVTPPPPTPPTPTPIPWTLEGYDGGPLTPGETLTLSATGLPVGTSVVVEIRSTPQVLGAAVADALGSFAIDVTIPTNLPPGDHTLAAIATPPGGVASEVAIPVVVEAPAPPADDESLETTSDEPTAAAAGAGADDRRELDRSNPAAPSAISDSIPTIDRIFRTPLVIATAGGLALAILLLVAFPAELLNSTLASNTRRIGRWYAAIDERIERATEWFAAVTRTRALAAALLVVVTSLIFGFVDPDYGFDPVSLRMTISLAIGLFLITYGASWISGVIIDRVWSIPSRIGLQPAALVFAVLGVVVARLLEFSPGFLIGLVIGLDLLARVGAPYRVRATLTNIGVIVGLAVLAWIGFSVLSAVATGEPTTVGLLVSDALVATTAEGLTAALAALMPLGFLQGHEIFRRSKLLWAGTFAAVGTIFALIVLPTAGEQDGDVADVGFWMLVMVIFAAVTLTLWAILHFTGERDADDEVLEAPVDAARS